MTTEDKERIEKDAEDKVNAEYDIDYPYEKYYIKGYIAGATAEHELLVPQLEYANNTVKKFSDALAEKEKQLKQERNKAIDVQKILTNSEGSNHLKWIYDRMIYVLGENPNMDYMHKFKSIIEKLTAHGEH